MATTNELESGVLLEEENEDTQEGKYLTFQLGKEEYGIEIRVVTEIIGIQNITELPDMPVYVKGVINLRGKVIPVIDVRLRFGFESVEYNERTCIIVVKINDMSIGLIVDEVSEVLDIPAENIENPSDVSKDSSSKFIKAFGKVGENVKILLNIQSLLFSSDLDMLTEAASA